MTVPRAFAIILGTGLAGSCLGAAVGYALAVLTPGYYASVFPGRAAAPGFSPVDVGVGLGLTQGLIAGAAIGCVVTLAVAVASRFRAPAIVEPAPKTWERAPRPQPSDAVRPAQTDVAP